MKLDIALCVPGLPFDGDTLKRGSLGGSETAGLYMGRELAALGHRVVLFCNTDKHGTYDGVTYRKTVEFGDYAQVAPHDVTIIQRSPQLFAAQMNSKMNVLWCHDLAVGRQGDTFRASLWNVDRVAVLSEFMASQYRDVYNLPDDHIIWQTRNGIDTSLFSPKPMQARLRNKLVFGARPERGLDVLIEAIFPTLLMKRSNLKLYIAGYTNPNREHSGFYEQIRQKIAEFPPGVVTVLPPLSKGEYYRHLEDACVYVYPTPSPTLPAFAEVSCISAMECQAAGLPIVTSRLGALPETIAPGAGVLLEGDPSSDRYVEEFCDAVLRYVRDDDAWYRASQAGRARSASLDWRAVAEQWADSFTRFIVDSNNSPRRLVQHFIRRSDIMAAKHLLAQQTGEWAATVQADIARDWGFAEAPDVYQEQYEKVGLTHTDVFDQIQAETRFQVMVGWLEEHPDITRVLDYGCAHGGYVVNLANRVGREWVGVDIDKHSITWAERNRVERAKRPETIQFKVGIHDIDLSDVARFDALIAGEVLEHVPDPTIIDSLERWVRRDGRVLLTVPFGPWEWMSYGRYPHRCHLWEFDLHDIQDLFGKKKDLHISVVAAGKCEKLNEPLGWHLIEYRVDGTPTGHIDMARKLALQRPRQNLSAVMIAGPGVETTLGWSLESLANIADEIVIGDCGMSDLARQIATAHGAKLIPASDPLKVGFETPRNEALAHATMDWVLGIDSDERLIEASAALKYLRQNIFHSYSITQHNFSCVGLFEPSIPIRLFRRGPNRDGKSLKWFGMIHEHPEFGMNEGAGRTIILRDVHLAHLGYISGGQQKERFARNLPLLRKDMEVYPDRLLQKHFLCRDHIIMAQDEAKASNGRLTPTIEARCREVMRLYREHFLGKPGLLSMDTLQYYSTALSILGEGVEVTWSLGAAKKNPDLGDQIKARFASYEEAASEIEWRLKDAMKPYSSTYW